MDILVNIFIVILLIVASVFFVYAIIYLKRITQSIGNMEKDLHGLVDRAERTFDGFEKAGDKLFDLVNLLELKTSETINYIDNFKEKTSDFFKGKNLIPKEGTSITNMINNFTAVAKGVSAFWNKLKD